MLGIFSVLSGNIIVTTLLFTALLLILIIKNCFNIKYIIAFLLVFYVGVINTSLRLKDVDELDVYSKEKGE